MSGPLPPVLQPLGLPASWIYQFAVARRNARFERQGATRRLPVPVVSVGNITVGGTGKSPVTRWIARRLMASGARPAIALRGYRSRGGVSDEACEHEALLPGVPVIVGADRFASVQAAMDRGVFFDCLVLDDGFQHRQLHRDLDVVLIDRRRPGLDGRLLPFGWLREPPSALARADAVLVTNAEHPDPELAARIERWHGRPPLGWFRHAWSGLQVHDQAGSRRVEVAWLAGQRVATALGIGNPAGIVRRIEDAGAEVVEQVPLVDHAAFGPRTVLRLAASFRGADTLLVTRKDWAKLERVIDSAFVGPVALPLLEVQPVAEIGAFGAMLDAIASAARSE